MITPAATPNRDRCVKYGGQWPLPYFLSPLLPAPFLRPHPFKLSLYFDLNYTSVKFPDCILHGCDAITVTKSVRRKKYKHLAKFFKHAYVANLLQWVFPEPHFTMMTQAPEVGRLEAGKGPMANPHYAGPIWHRGWCDLI